WEALRGIDAAHTGAIHSADSRQLRVDPEHISARPERRVGLVGSLRWTRAWREAQSGRLSNDGIRGRRLDASRGLRTRILIAARGRRSGPPCRIHSWFFGPLLDGDRRVAAARVCSRSASSWAASPFTARARLRTWQFRHAVLLRRAARLTSQLQLRRTVG